MVNCDYVNGLIAVKETTLLGEKLLRFPEMTAEEVLRTLRESGFGDASGDAEAMCTAEEGALDAFIRAYAPTRAIRAYLLMPRDFHNLKALLKAQLLDTDATPMLGPEGLKTVAELRQLPQISEPPEELRSMSGAELGALLEKELYQRLFAACKGSALLKKLLVGKVDRLNLLTALRAPGEDAERYYLPGGTLGKEDLGRLAAGETEAQPPYVEFFRLARAAKEAGQPFTDAERALDCFEAEYFSAHRFELEGKEPFLYYVFRRRAEITNVRIVLVCLRAGLSEREIKRRLRAV